MRLTGVARIFSVVHFFSSKSWRPFIGPQYTC